IDKVIEGPTKAHIDNVTNQTIDENNMMERVEREIAKFLMMLNQNDTEIYDLSKGEPINDLALKIGSNEYPRYSCACHKLNYAIRHALAKHCTVCSTMLSIIRKFVVSLEKSTSLYSNQH
ncbi:unnamed protein product, partial [Brachionus calyciflorus]